MITDAMAWVTQNVQGQNYDDGFMTVELHPKEDGTADLLITDGNGTTIYTQHYTTQPLFIGFCYPWRFISSAGRAMTIDEQNIATYHAICAVVLRELRVQRRMHPAQFADFLAKPPSAWHNIESGKTRLDFDTLLRVGRGLGVQAGAILQVADGYEFFLRSFEWSVVVNDLEGKDGLMKQANDYWKSPGCRADEGITYGLPILNVPHQNNGWQNVANVFGYAVDPQFRSQQNDGERFKPFPSALDLAAQNGGNGGIGTNGINGDLQGI